jgi:hypothetical protein
VSGGRTLALRDVSGGRTSSSAPPGGCILARVGPDGSPTGLREALAGGWRELALYVAAGAVYIAIGVAFPEFLFTLVAAAGYLLFCVAVLPWLVWAVRR